MLSKSVRILPFFAHRLHRVLRRLPLHVALLVSTNAFSAVVGIVERPVPPTITLSVTDSQSASGMNIDSANNGLFPYFAGGTVTWPIGDVAWAAGADIYFGVISPGGLSTYTWSPNNGVVTLNQGYAPIALAISNKSTYQLSDNKGNSLKYTFSGAEPKGMYILFLLMVSPGADPNDTKQWRQVDMQPFFVK